MESIDFLKLATYCLKTNCGIADLKVDARGSGLRNRKAALAALETAAEGRPILIVGGGINGVGLFRDLALQNVPALLVENGDFCSGTSAASSRLIHGGLRYLETGEFALVRESVVERNHLLRSAPHLVVPLRVWVPAFDWFGGLFSAGLRFLKWKKEPGAKGLLAVKIGLLFFDRFGRANRVMPNHRLVKHSETRRRMPSLSPRVKAVAEYYDARLTHPERLVLELLEDAERDCPASVAVPYMALARSEDGTVLLRDKVDGAEMRVRPSLVVNCAGAWVDEVNRRLGVEGRLIGGTRGSHLVLRRPDLAGELGAGMLYFETQDFRACLIYALNDELVLVGTTDIRDQDPDNAACSDDEVAYLFDVLQQVMPDAAPRREEIVFAYAGIRPLPFSDDAATGAISRDHSLRKFEPKDTNGFPVLVLLGGKWTTYRACAEQVADAVLAHLGMQRSRTTLNEPIGGGKRLPDGEGGRRREGERLASTFAIDPVLAQNLLRRYGTRASAVAECIGAGADGATAPIGPYHEGEIRWIAAEERVTRLADIVLRRTLLPFENAISSNVLERIAHIAGDVLGWDAARQRSEVAEVKRLLQEHHRMRFEE